MSRPLALQELTLTDPVHDPTRPPDRLERFAGRFINDGRDVPFLRLAAGLTLTVFPAAAYLYWPGNFRWWLAIPYWLWVLGVNLGPFVLMLHNTSHRRLFKRRYDWLNQYIPWVLGPFFGETPGSYFAHHVGMHHAEENLPSDLSSTMRYQRDSLADFLRYFGRFFFGCAVELPRYFARRRRRRLMRMSLVGESTGLILAAALALIDWRATVVVFAVPFLVVRFAMMAGNWGQHAFIDAADPGNAMKNSISCINASYNRRCFNDGYHIGHHLQPTRHWTEMPADLLASRAKYAAAGALVFHGIDFFRVWLWLMLKRYDWLARHMVSLDAAARPEAERIELLRLRTRRITDGAAAAPELAVLRA